MEAKLANPTGIRNRAIVAAACAALAATAAGWSTAPARADDATQPTNAQLQAEVQALKSQVATLQAKSDQQWTSDQEAAQMKAIAEEVVANSQQQAASGLQAGYNNGFYIQDANKDFTFNVNGYLQIRYTYAHADYTIEHGTSVDTNQLSFRRARLIFSGNLYKNFFYNFTSEAASGTFTMLDYYVGYKFSPMLSVTAGSHLVPFTYDEIYSSGQEFPELPDTNRPFDEGRALGVDVLGEIVPATLSYDFQISNGANSAGGTNAGSGGIVGDNRMGFYGRVQYAPAADMGDFGAESDWKYHKDFVWMLGVAAGYDEQKPIGTTPYYVTDIGLSSNPTPGFVGTGSPIGSIYEATIDWHAKYRGFAFNTAGFFRDTNAETLAFAAPAPIGAYPHSFKQYGYYFEGGYMFVPKQWEVVGKFEQLLTDGMPNRMEVYSVGLNYYIFGDNAKIQSAITWVPDEAAYSNNATATIINTQDIIYQLQLQVKF